MNPRHPHAGAAALLCVAILLALTGWVVATSEPTPVSPTHTEETK